MTIEELVNNLDGVINQIRSIQGDIVDHLSSNQLMCGEEASFYSTLSYALGAAEITLVDISMDVRCSDSIAKENPE